MEAPEAPDDSPLALETAMASPLYRKLMDPELRPGDPAFAFELPLLEPETHRPSGDSSGSPASPVSARSR